MPTLDRLTALDATFLHYEHAHTPLHVAGLYIFEGTPDIPGRPGLGGLFQTIAERLPEVPRYRQRALPVPLGLGQPVWVDDPDFDLSYHLRRAALPAPGGVTELLDYVARIHARPLDHRRPLWEAYVIEGLADGRLALYNKTHHAMIDGISGVDLATILLDRDPEGRRPTVTAPFRPAALPAGTQMVAATLREGFGDLGRGVAGAVRRPWTVPGRMVGAVAGTTQIGRLLSLLRPVPESPLNVPVGAARRISLVSISLARAKAVKNASGGTVNDVVLAAVGEAFDHFLTHRGVAHQEQVYRVMVPVSVRDETERMALGNRVAAMFVDLPVGSMPARRRLAAVTHAMKDLKERRQAVAADRLIALAGLAPATLHGLAGRLEFTNQRLLNSVVSNVPGVQYPLYSGGARLLETYPLLPLTANLGVIICVTSYNGGLYFGIIGDYDAVPDVDVIGAGLRRGFERLERSVGATRGQNLGGGYASEAVTVVPAVGRRTRRRTNAALNGSPGSGATPRPQPAAADGPAPGQTQQP
ncbi:MAG TPA: wax ester/triacylglycerol synthase family O-acyltransferase [Candidatus Dormibacteraeota bacterium]